MLIELGLSSFNDLLDDCATRRWLLVSNDSIRHFTSTFSMQ